MKKRNTLMGLMVVGLLSCVLAGCGNKTDNDESNKDNIPVEPASDHSPSIHWYEKDGEHYHICTGCGYKIDEEKHTLTEVPAKAATHYDGGNIRYYECSVCHMTFLDSKGKVLVKDVKTKALGHDSQLTLHPEVPATCTDAGTKAYYSCSCGALFMDAKGTTRISEPMVIEPLGHVSSGIWHSDTTHHWHECARCGSEIDKVAHIEGSDYIVSGAEQAHHCTVCDHVVGDAIANTGCHHENVIRYDRQEPSLTESGHIEFYYCLDCNKSFNERYCIHEIENSQYSLNDKRDGRYLAPLTTTFSVLNDNVKQYLDAESDAEVITALKNTTPNNNQAKKKVTWKDNGHGPYVVELSDSRNFETFTSFASTTHSCLIGGYLTPGQTYYYRVKDSLNEYIVDDLSFKVDDDYSLRTIAIDGVNNVRDIGGWATEDGQKVAYGKVYRGGRLPDITELGKEVFLTNLGIKTEIDLRYDGTSELIDPRLTYVKTAMWQYTQIIPGISVYSDDGNMLREHDPDSLVAIKQIFELIADESNLPMYIHCISGADRTGTFMYLLNGLLGVSYEDLTRDFELTTFSAEGNRYRSKLNATEDGFDKSGIYLNNNTNYIAWNKMNDFMNKKYAQEDEKLSSMIEYYLKTVCLISDQTIQSVKANLLVAD